MLRVQALGGMPEATGATCLGIDRYGMDILAELPDGRRRGRLEWVSPLTSPAQLRQAAVDLTNAARKAIGIVDEED